MSNRHYYFWLLSSVKNTLILIADCSKQFINLSFKVIELLTKMSKKINSLNWQSVALEGVPTSTFDNLQGFVGLEECTDYGTDKNNKRKKKVGYVLILD